MKFIELFAGIGGFRYGLENCNIRPHELECCQRPEERNNATDKLQQRKHLDYVCVYANEFNKYAAQIYKERFKDEIDTRDIREVKAEEIPDHELLTAGFPCQAFSIAGKRGGFEDTRGTLFFEIARIAKQKQPRLLLLENVKGLLSHDKGKTFGTILNTLDELGYDLQWQVLNSKDFGVPQNRERVFIIGHLRGTSRPEVFPIGEVTKIFTKKRGFANTLTARYHKDGKEILIEITKNMSQGYRVYDPNGVSTTLAGEAGGVGAKTGLYAIPVLTPDRPEKRQNGRRFKENGDTAFTLTSQDRHGVFDGVKIRRLTPTECERLQGFPDNWTKYGKNTGSKEKIHISDTQRYKCLGNAVTTNVISAIGENLV